MKPRSAPRATVFADIGALAWYLRSVPWAVPGFTVSTYRQALLSASRQTIRSPPSEVLAASPQVAHLAHIVGSHPHDRELLRPGNCGSEQLHDLGRS